MNYEERVLAYIDILGFADAVGKTVGKNNGKEIENRCEIEKIDNLLDEEHFQIKNLEYLTGEKQKIKGKVTSQFSDSIVISYSNVEDIYLILLNVYLLCVMALEKGFLYRGAVVYGKVIHTDNKLFGPAFIKACEMEQKQAIFPRIIIDDDVLEIAKRKYSECADPDSGYNNLLKLIPRDFDGNRYINYIDKLYTGVGVGFNDEQEHRTWLCEIIKKLEEKINTDAGIKSKYLWLKEKYEKGLSASGNQSYGGVE